MLRVAHALATTAVLASISLALAGSGRAQSDDFDDDFGTPAPAPAPRPGPAPAPAPRPAPAPAPAPRGDFDDDFATPAPAPAPAPRGDFDDDFGTPAPAPAPRPAPAAEQDDPFAQDLPPTSASGAEEATEEAPARAAEDEASLRARRFRTANSFFGPTGGIRVVDAGAGPVGTFRLAFMTDFMYSRGYLLPDDFAKHIGGALSLSLTVHRNIEIFGAVQSTANSNDQGDPELYQALGDFSLGLKAFGEVSPWFTLGGDFRLAFMNPVGDIGVVMRSTSVGLRANATFDFRRLPSRSIPFVIRFNTQYWFDNSWNLVRGVERARYDSIADPLPRPEESRHLITRIERFGLQVNRTDFVNLGLGLEVPLELGERFALQPLLEWNWGIPVNRQDYVCPLTGIEGDDGCLADDGPKAFPMTLTLGARIFPVLRGLSFTVAADVGLTGHRTFVRELAPNLPYAIIIGASYGFDPEAREPQVREIERVVEVPAPVPVRGRVAGVVLEAGTETPVDGAVVRFPGRDVNGIVASADGHFLSYVFDPGDVGMEISHPEYEPGVCTATIPSERPVAAATEPVQDDLVVEVRCELVAKPRVGSVTLHVVGEEGRAIPNVTVEVTGGVTRTLTTDASGNARLAEVPPGTYTIRVDAEGFFLKQQEVSILPRQDGTVEVPLLARPRRSAVRLRGRRITISRQVNYVTDSDEILPSSDPLLYEVADLLMHHPEIRLVEIEGHTDDRGGSEHNLDLSQRRAESVRRWLVTHGIEESRLTARGYGSQRPLVPNITARNRARNRRVQFTVQQTAEDAAD